jgi:hypothetical protein
MRTNAYGWTHPPFRDDNRWGPGCHSLAAAESAYVTGQVCRAVAVGASNRHFLQLFFRNPTVRVRLRTS